MLIIWKFPKSTAGRTCKSTAGRKCPRGPHVARGTRVWDLWPCPNMIPTNRFRKCTNLDSLASPEYFISSYSCCSLLFSSCRRWRCLAFSFFRSSKCFWVSPWDLKRATTSWQEGDIRTNPREDTDGHVMRLCAQYTSGLVCKSRKALPK